MHAVCGNQMCEALLNLLSASVEVEIFRSCCEFQFRDRVQLGCDFIWRFTYWHTLACCLNCCRSWFWSSSSPSARGSPSVIRARRVSRTILRPFWSWTTDCHKISDAISSRPVVKGSTRVFLKSLRSRIPTLRHRMRPRSAMDWLFIRFIHNHPVFC